MPLYRAHPKSLLDKNKNIFINPYLNLPRRPLTTPKRTHEIWGNWFQSQFGDNYRERAIFCTGNVKQAEFYMSEEHELIEIWPVGNFRICYSKRIPDLFDHFFTGNFSGKPDSEEDVFKELEEAGYLMQEDHGIEEAIKAQCEIMIIASSFSYKFLNVI
jgi:hypothetical protein